jgi:hypothetical protein
MFGNNQSPYLSGGIFANNFFYTSGIYFPSSTNCSATNCYISGSNLSQDGIFSYSSPNISTNTKSNCFSEQYDNPCGYVQIFNNYNAITVLQQIGTIWLIPDLCSYSSPFILLSFIKTLYDCNYTIVKCCENKHSQKGIFQPSYYIIDVNCLLKPSNITICKLTGKLNFNKVKQGDYSIRILNGKKKIILSADNLYNSTTYIDYNLHSYYLKSIK